MPDEIKSPAEGDQSPPAVTSAEAAKASVEMSRALASLGRKPEPSHAARLHAKLESGDGLDETPTRIYNKSSHSYTHTHPLTRVDHVAAAATFSMVPAWIAEMWATMYPENIMSSEQASKNANALGTALEAANKRAAESEAKTTDLAARVAELEKLLAAKKK